MERVCPKRARSKSRLLTHVIETLQQSPGIHRVEAQLLVHEAGVLARPFLDQGFRRHPRLFMVIPLSKASRPAPSVFPRFEIRGWMDSDYQSAAAVITAAYRGHVDAEINDQYRTLSGSLRFLNNIVRFPGCGLFDSESSFVVTHRASRHVASDSFCVHACEPMLDMSRRSASSRSTAPGASAKLCSRAPRTCCASASSHSCLSL